MRYRFTSAISIACVLVFSFSAAHSQKTKPKTKTPAVAAPTPTPEPPIRGPNTKEGASQASKSTKVLSEIMGTPDKGIPSDLLDKAECIMVFPNVIKGGFIVGGQGGRGVASCRTRSGWSAPAYFEIKGGSVGLQIGGQSTDFVLLIMNESGMKNLLSDKFELGGEASRNGTFTARAGGHDEGFGHGQEYRPIPPNWQPYHSSALSSRSFDSAQD